ncbi:MULTISPECIES: hypothetical protein [Okeania]|uniref:Uncharacterized protein n=1 Tax=Okeania hirsuta TaxID=1458930 RepID=A0A3N6NLK9_9CYAN|nr:MULTISPECIES: hypothetical protein [Okeania]NET15838.1 hypothetical protein [Okeania sp. SIO1H6]NES79398.1 hypothetical protein [Okeania sp. SIO1H4]NET23056.1 hypothetical protein [Okeania sp. SIO1H5]NET97183.1 hypothetical protein [Okeania sp. SIO1H2]RQH16664.1 hypothetical protein D4Z78_20235 [Okeania hirsuta]
MLFTNGRDVVCNVPTKSEGLNVEEKLQLMCYLSSHLQRDDNSTPKPRRQWHNIQGKATYPLVGEDAQQWIY